MSGQYLNSDFSLPCPPGLEIPEQQHYTITANTLKVSLPWAAGRCGAGQGVTGEPASLGPAGSGPSAVGRAR